MKNALIISILFHTFIFTADFGIGMITNKTRSAPANPVRGFSVDMIHDNSMPSQNARSGSAIQPDIPAPHKKPVSKKPQQSGNHLPASRLQRSSVPFSGSELKNWLLEYYSIILKLIKAELEKIGVSAGNIEIILVINRQGAIHSVQILSSEYPRNTESRITHQIQKIQLPVLPDRYDKALLKLKLRVVYR